MAEVSPSIFAAMRSLIEAQDGEEPRALTEAQVHQCMQAVLTALWGEMEACLPGLTVAERFWHTRYLAQALVRTTGAVLTPEERAQEAADG